jgi:hypothetical protein
VFNFRARKNDVLDLFKGEDQESLRRELAIHFGPRADIFLHTYEKMRAGALKNSNYFAVLTWCWPAFLISFVWYFYRRLYIFGAIFLLAPIVLALLVGDAGSSGAWASTAILGKPLYVTSALNRIVKANKLGLIGPEREDYIRRSGGVSWVAGIVAGCLFAGLIALAIFAAVDRN